MSANRPRTLDIRWERMQELFSRAVDLPETERTAFVNHETQGDPDLREELLGLLACDTGKSTGPLTHALGEALDSTTRDKRRAYVGRVVGNYKLVSVLGHGGTGTVYLGERADRQYSAQVAVKIVDSAAIHGDLGTRFRAERQILASLNHPNISRLLDAGETSEGQPYLVMEYVHGEPLDRYCDGKQLDVRARLALFLDICAAVQYAHQNLIVHRDLKPANILVTAQGVPKLLDFGIAKLLDAGDATAALALTRMNDRLLTPEYASPEQILGRPVTTASDAYALGVVLYELLTGLRPYVVPSSASQLELERSICISDPQRPSAAIRRMMESGPEEGQSNIAAIALARSLTPERLRRRLLGDIDAIIMRALRKEPQHRYRSVDQLMDDIRRYLTREPVQARQGNWIYYSQRFVRRNVWGVSAGVAFTLFTLAFAIAMSIQTKQTAAQRDRATQESEIAEEVSSIIEDVLAAAEPFQNLGKEITAQQLLDSNAEKIQKDLSKRPEVRARLLDVIGRTYRRQGQPQRAITYLEDSLRIRRELGSEDPKMVATLAELSIALRQTSRFEDAYSVLQDALRISTANQQQRSVSHAQLLHNLGQLELLQGQLDNADEHLATALNIIREIHGTKPHADAGEILITTANARAWRDDVDGAVRAAQEAVDIYVQFYAENHPDRVQADSTLADALYRQGRVNEAGALYERALTAQKMLYGEHSQWVADTLESLAQVRLAQRRLAEAEALAREAIEANRKSRKELHLNTGFSRATLARILTEEDKFAEAEIEFKASLDTFAQTLDQDHQYVASTEYFFGELLLTTRRLADAEALLSASMNRWKRIKDSPPWRAARSASALGEALRQQGRPEAEKYLVEGYRTLAGDPRADKESQEQAHKRVTFYYTQRGERQKLDDLLQAVNHGNAVVVNPK